MLLYKNNNNKKGKVSQQKHFMFYIGDCPINSYILIYKNQAK